MHITSVPDLLYFFFTDPPTTEFYTLSLHDALPISLPACTRSRRRSVSELDQQLYREVILDHYKNPRYSCWSRDRKSTRLNSSHPSISYAVFCLKKKN